MNLHKHIEFMIVKFYAKLNVPSRSWNSVGVIVFLFAILTMLFRLNEDPFAVNERQTV